MFIRTLLFALLCAPALACAQEPALYSTTLNPVYGVTSLYQPKTGTTMVGIFNQQVGAYQKISVYSEFSDKSPTPAADLTLVLQTIDDHKVNRPQQMPATLTLDGVAVPIAPLQKTSTQQSTQHITDITVTPAVEKDIPVFISIYWGTVPFDTLQKWASARDYDLEFDKIHLAHMWLTTSMLQSLNAAIKAESALFASTQLIPYRKDGKYGYADTRGRIVIAPQYDFAGGFHEGLARVAVNDPQAVASEDGLKRRYGYIDTAGQQVIPLKYAGASNFVNGVAQVIPIDGGKSIMINKSGQMPTAGPDALGWKYAVNQGTAGWGTWMTDGMVMAKVQIGGKGPYRYGFWDINGKLIVPAKYDDATHYKNGKSSLRDGKDWYLVDKAGATQKMARPSGVSIVDGYADNGFALVKKDNACKDPSKAWANQNANLLERLCIDGFGFADATGRLAVPPVYIKGTQFSGGLAAVAKPFNCQRDTCRARFTFVDTTGKELLPASFQRAEPFSEGMAAVILALNDEGLQTQSILFAQNGGYLYIDRNGPGPSSLVPITAAPICTTSGPCQITQGPFEDNIAPITFKYSGGAFTYRMDRAGRIYWDGK